MPIVSTEGRVTRLLVVALLAATALRIVASVVSGFATLGTTRGAFPAGQQRAGEVLWAFGAGGDTIQALLLVAALVLLWRGSASAAAQRSWLAALAVATIVLVLCRVAGALVITRDLAGGPAMAQQAVAVGYGVADLVLVGTVLAAGRLLTRAEATEITTGDESMLFAVDRRTGEVHAFYTAAQARRAISTYSVEDDEFCFYDDEGHVLHADLVEGLIRFTPTERDARDELVARLRAFAQQKGLEVEDPDEPLSYLAPVNHWQWLQLWPGWMRPLGRAARGMRRI